MLSKQTVGNGLIQAAPTAMQANGPAILTVSDGKGDGVQVKQQGRAGASRAIQGQVAAFAWAWHKARCSRCGKELRGPLHAVGTAAAAAAFGLGSGVLGSSGSCC